MDAALATKLYRPAIVCLSTICAYDAEPLTMFTSSALSTARAWPLFLHQVIGACSSTTPPSLTPQGVGPYRTRLSKWYRPWYTGLLDPKCTHHIRLLKSLPACSTNEGYEGRNESSEMACVTGLDTYLEGDELSHIVILAYLKRVGVRYCTLDF